MSSEDGHQKSTRYTPETDQDNDDCIDIDGLFEVLLPETRATEMATSDRQIAELQEQLSDVNDVANEDRFYFSLILLIVADVFAFKYLGDYFSVLLVFLLECVLMAGLAKRFGVEEPQVWFASFIRWAMRKKDNPES